MALCRRPADAKDVKVDVDFDFEKCSQEEALAKLGSNVANGLSESAVPDLRRQWGPNKLEEVQDNKLLKFLGYMWNPLSWCMEVAAIIAIGILDYVDFILIILLLLLNASIGERSFKGSPSCTQTCTLILEAYLMSSLLC